MYIYIYNLFDGINRRYGLPILLLIYRHSSPLTQFLQIATQPRLNTPFCNGPKYYNKIFSSVAYNKVK